MVAIMCSFGLCLSVCVWVCAAAPVWRHNNNVITLSLRHQQNVYCLWRQQQQRLIATSKLFHLMVRSVHNASMCALTTCSTYALDQPTPGSTVYMWQYSIHARPQANYADCIHKLTGLKINQLLQVSPTGRETWHELVFLCIDPQLPNQTAKGALDRKSTTNNTKTRFCTFSAESSKFHKNCKFCVRLA